MLLPVGSCLGSHAFAYVHIDEAKLRRSDCINKEDKQQDTISINGIIDDMPDTDAPLRLLIRASAMGDSRLATNYEGLVKCFRKGLRQHAGTARSGRLPLRRFLAELALQSAPMHVQCARG